MVIEKMRMISHRRHFGGRCSQISYEPLLYVNLGFTNIATASASIVQYIMVTLIQYKLIKVFFFM